MIVDLDRIPRDGPYAVHIPTLEHAKIFVDEMKARFPDSVYNWPDQPHFWESRLVCGGNYYFPRLHLENPYLTHGSRETYIGMGVALMSFDDILVPEAVLDTDLGDMPIESLFG